MGEPRVLWDPRGCLTQHGGEGGLPGGRTSELVLEHTAMTQAKGREMAYKGSRGHKQRPRRRRERAMSLANLVESNGGGS